MHALLSEITQCDNTVGLTIIPFARVRSRVTRGYPRRCFALVVHHVVVHVSREVTHRGRDLTLVANRDLNRITDRALPTLMAASCIYGVPILHPLVNVSGRRVIRVSHGVSAFRASVLPCRSYYAIFAPGRPGAHPALTRYRTTRTGLSVSKLVRGTVDRATCSCISWCKWFGVGDQGDDWYFGGRKLGYHRNEVLREQTCVRPCGLNFKYIQGFQS